MEPEETSSTAGQEDKFTSLKKVTPLSKYLAMALFVILPFIGGWVGYNYAPEKVVEMKRVVIQEVVESESGKDLVVYTNDSLGISFEYPSVLVLSESDGVVELHHDIPYVNHSDCDMIGDPDITHERLTDFKMSFEIVSPKVVPPYTDGDISTGSIDGVLAYKGIEGCGVTEYYFDIDDQHTLVIAQENIQALNGLSNNWNEEEILAVPGVISHEENRGIFKQILSSLSIYDDSDILFGKEARDLCGPEPPAVCETGKSLGCDTSTLKWGCFEVRAEKIEVDEVPKDNGQVSKIESGQASVVIFTDKIEYNEGEIINISVNNGLDEFILYNHGDKFWGIEYFEDGGWIDPGYEEGGGFQMTDMNVGGDCYIRFFELSSPSRLSAKSDLSYEWNQRVCPFGTGGPGEPRIVKYIGSGKYRLVFNYGFNVPEDNPYKILDRKKVYSNVFTIK